MCEVIIFSVADYKRDMYDNMQLANMMTTATCLGLVGNSIVSIMILCLLADKAAEQEYQREKEVEEFMLENEFSQYLES